MKLDGRISVRLDNELIKELDEFCQYHSYWTRSHVIARLIERFLHYSSRNTQFQIINYDVKGNLRKEIRVIEVSEHKDVNYQKPE